MATNQRTCVGVFHDRRRADAAVDELRSLGFDRDAVSIVARGREGEERFRGWDDEDVDRGADRDRDRGDVGAGEGAAVGGLTGLLIGAGLMLIPGVGPIFAVGPLAAGLAGAVTGAAAGAVTGGIAAALIDLGVPEEEARYYESRVGEGAYLVTVDCAGRDAEVRAILNRHGADEIRGGAPGVADRAATMAPGVAATPDVRGREEIVGGGQTVQLREEELTARRERVQAGEVDIHKDVVAEQRTMDVPVTREEVVVERHPVEGRVSDRPIGEGESVRVPIREEEVTVEKRPVVREELEVGKRAVTETEEVSGTVRREEVRIEREDDVNIRAAGPGGTPTQRWEDVMPRYRSNWQQRSGGRGGRWEDSEPGYRYGWEMSNEARYRGRS